MSDQSGLPNMPGTEALTKGVAAVTQSMQGFATEMQRMSKESFDHANQAMEKLRGAKTFEEVVAIQTSYLQQSFTNYADSARRFSEMMMTLPAAMAKQGQEAMQEGRDAMKAATEHHQG